MAGQNAPYCIVQFLGRRSILNNKRILSWFWVILCSLAIFSLIPFGNTIQKFISDSLGKSFFIYLIFTLLGIASIGTIYFLFLKLKIRALKNYIWLLILAVLYVYFTLKLRKSPVEVTHFLEYGILSILVFKALNHDIKDKTIYFSTMLIILIIGTLDEIIQWIVPGRIWNFKDVGLNVISGGLIQLGIWKVVRPKLKSGKMNPRSIRISTSLFASSLIILGLCASNTPQLVDIYTRHIPWLSYLQKEEPMSEFGYKHNDPEIGVFYSRMNPTKLRKTDNQRGEECAKVLNESVNINYRQFIKEYNPISNPFMHELRVHIFRRDTYFKKARSASDSNEKKEFYFIAYKENHILEKYYGNTTRKSVYSWDEKQIKEVEELIDKSKFYKSPVSANLFTSFSVKAMWIAIIAIISILIAINMVIFLKEKRKSQ